MANVGDNFTPNQSPEANFTNEVGDGRASASLDYLDEAMKGFFTRLEDKLSQAGIELPELDLFDSGSSRNGQGGGDYSGDYDYEPGESEEGNGNRSPFEGRTPYTQKELGGDLISENKDMFDFNEDGIAQRNEVRAYRDTLAKGSLERRSVNTVLDDFKAVKRLSNDQRGEDNGLSDRDLARMKENIQLRGRLNGYPSDVV